MSQHCSMCQHVRRGVRMRCASWFSASQLLQHHRAKSLSGQIDSHHATQHWSGKRATLKCAIAWDISAN